MCCSVLLQCVVADRANSVAVGYLQARNVLLLIVHSIPRLGVCCCGVLLQCVVAVCCCNELLHCVVAVNLFMCVAARGTDTTGYTP